MSIIVAVKKNGKTVIGADSLHTFGSNRPCKGNFSEPKYMKIGNSYFANTGWGIYDNIIKDYVKNIKNPNLNNKNTIFTFFNNLWKSLHDKYSFVNDQCDEKDDPFGDLDATFIIVNKKGIYYVSSNMSVTEFNKFHAIGSGCDFAIGAMYAVYDRLKTAEEIARIGIETAIEHNIYCGGDIEISAV